MNRFRKIAGVTLLEILLVLAIMSAILVMTIGYLQQRTDELRQNRASLYMQQILNASLSYYIANSAWPDSVSTLQTKGFLPAVNTFANPWGGTFNIVVNPNNKALLYVVTNVATRANAQIIAGRVPLGYVSDATGAANVPPTQGACTTTPVATTCTYVVAGVNIPGQNLNNATAVNYAGLYHSGACVPAPTCPVDSATGTPMKPAIYVVPASVSGITDAFAAGGTPKVYPISSFTAFARGDASGNPVPLTTAPLDCVTTGTAATLPCNYTDGALPPYPDLSSDNGKNYWRVCLSIVTEKGYVAPKADPTGSDRYYGQRWGIASGTVLAFTRCIPNSGNEKPTGSAFDVWVPGNYWSP